jgi:hypothetical protein
MICTEAQKVTDAADPDPERAGSGTCLIVQWFRIRMCNSSYMTET